MASILPNKTAGATAVSIKKQAKPERAARPERGPACGGALGASGDSGDALGIYAKSVHTSGFDGMARRVERFALQAVSRRLLPKSRTANCLRVRAFQQEVGVWKCEEHNTAHYSGLQTCASVWACPVCAAKIAERRRAEVLFAMATHKAQGGSVQLLTLTAPHTRADKLIDLLTSQAKALQRFWNDRKTKAIFQEMGQIGFIRAREVTHGRLSGRNNGWHPHYHVLLFVGAACPDMRRDWEVRLYLRWAAACEFAGLGTPTIAHGLKLDDGEKAGAYASKWGLEDELTKGHIKKGKQGGETPFDLLRACLADSGDKQAAALFREYAEAFKGQRQLYWTKGLKARFAVQDANDEQIAERQEEGAYLLGQISIEQWRDVLACNARAIVLDVAAKAGWYEVERLLWLIEGAANGVIVPGEVLNQAHLLLTRSDPKAPAEG